MKRGLILGAVGFAAAFVAERQFVALKKDIDRYDRLRAMSGEGPLYKQLAGEIGTSISNNRPQRPGGSKALFGSLASDVIRYVRIRAM
ncbi:MAG: hypothetical protein NVSMB5_13830 [Candidatus Velthaea sp.]